MTKLAFVDLETTGLDPERHDIWEVGLIVEDEEDKRGVSWYYEEYHAFIPISLRTADATALRIGQLYDRHPEFNGDAGVEIVEPADVARRVALLTAGAHLVGNVVSFDARFLDAFLSLHDLAPSWHYHLVDCEALVAGRLALSPPWKSDELSEMVGVQKPEVEHTAFGDAQWSRQLYYAALGREAP